MSITNINFSNAIMNNNESQESIERKNESQIQDGTVNMTERLNETAFSNLHPVEFKYEQKVDKSKWQPQANKKIMGVTINNQKKKMAQKDPLQQTSSQYKIQKPKRNYMYNNKYDQIMNRTRPGKIKNAQMQIVPHHTVNPNMVSPNGITRQMYEDFGFDTHYNNGGSLVYNDPDLLSMGPSVTFANPQIRGRITVQNSTNYMQ